MERAETWGQSIAALIAMMGCILMIAALCLMIAPPDERVVHQDDRVTIVKRHE